MFLGGACVPWTAPWPPECFLVSWLESWLLTEILPFSSSCYRCYLGYKGRIQRDFNGDGKKEGLNDGVSSGVAYPLHLMSSSLFGLPSERIFSRKSLSDILMLPRVCLLLSPFLSIWKQFCPITVYNTATVHYVSVSLFYLNSWVKRVSVFHARSDAILNA